MFSSLQSAVYRCPLLVDKPFAKSSGTYHSPVYHSQSETPFFKAWPGLGVDPHQPCCLPTLMRARYFINRGTLIKLEAVVARAENYLSCQDSIEPKVKEVALAIVKHHQTLWRYLPNIVDCPPILFGVDRIQLTDLKLKEPEEFSILHLAQETAIQGLIYGNLTQHEDLTDMGNLFDVNDAFSLAHETGHDLARLCHCGHLLNELSREAQSILVHFAIAKFSPDQITEEWSKFRTVNDCIYHLSKKFEPIEEIFANYVGLRFSPINVRNEVKVLVNSHLIERKWFAACNAFAEVCNNAEEAWLPVASLITDAVSRILTYLDFNGFDIGNSAANVLYNFVEILKLIWLNVEDTDDPDTLLESIKLAEKKAATPINRMLEQAGIPEEIYRYVSAVMQEAVIPKHLRASEAILNNNSKRDEGEHTEGCHPRITLIGYEAGKRIQPVSLTSCTYYDADYVQERFFFESLRQQLYHRCGLVCPFGFMYKCCGRSEGLKRIYELLPEEEKNYLSAPDCGNHR